MSREPQAQWFDRLVDNPHVEAVMIADSDGHILRSSRLLRSDQERVASMFQTLMVLAQTLAEEVGDHVHNVQLMLELSHVLIFPVVDATCFLIVQVERAAPLLLLGVEFERVIGEISASDIALLYEQARFDDNNSLNADELIDAVQEWLRNRPSGSR